MKYFQLLQRKIKIWLSKATVFGSFRQEITMGKCKTKVIQTNLGTFRHNQTYPGIIRAYSKSWVTLAYLESWYIQNPGIFRTRSIFRALAYSQPWYTQNRYIQKAGIFKIRAKFRTLSNIYYEAFCKDS